MAEAEARAQAAREEAEFQNCRAQVKEVRAEIERRRANCAKALADQNLCVARNSERTAESGLLGCTVGIIAAMWTGGAAAWALGGCAVGAGAGALSEDICPQATCVAEIDSYEGTVLSERGLVSMPRCGGYTGVELAPREQIAAGGLSVTEVAPGTYADTASMARGDVLIELNGYVIRSEQDLKNAIEFVNEGAPLTAAVVRNGDLFKLDAPASRRTGSGNLEEKIIVGIKYETLITPVSYRAGVVVGMVVPGSPAAVAGLRIGDSVDRLGAAAGTNAGPRNENVTSVRDVEIFLEDTRSSEEVLFSLDRGGTATEIRVKLAARSGRSEL